MTSSDNHGVSCLSNFKCMNCLKHPLTNAPGVQNTQDCTFNINSKLNEWTIIEVMD